MKIEIIPDRRLLKIAKKLGGPAARKAMIKGLNVAGKRLRMDVPAIVIGDLVSTSKAALGQKARAASEKRSRDPLSYSVRLKGAVPVAKLKADARKFKRSKPGSEVGSLRLKSPGLGGDIDFKSVKKGEAKGFGLTEAGPLPARGVGAFGYREKFRESKKLKRRLEQAGKDAIKEIESALFKALGAKR